MNGIEEKVAVAAEADFPEGSSVSVVKPEAEASVKVGEPQGDILDGIANVIIAGEVAHRDNRTAGRQIVVDLPKEGEADVDIINTGRPDLLATFHRVLDKDKVRYRDIVVEADVTEDPEKIGKLHDMADRQLEAAQATGRRKALEVKLGLPALPLILENKLVGIEEKLPDLGLPGNEENKIVGGQENDASKGIE